MPGLADMTTDERQLLLSFLRQQRDGIRNAAFGLSDEQLRAKPTAGALSIGGLLKHVVATESVWVDGIAGVERSTDPEAYGDTFELTDDDTSDSLLTALAARAAASEELVRSVGIDDPVPVPRGVPWFPDDLDAWSVRWVLLHLIEEIARHAGHADIVRESLDGATMYPLMAAAEGWEPQPWLQPWAPDPELDPAAAG